MTPDRQPAAAKDQLTLVLSFFSRVDSKFSLLLAINTAMLAVLTTNAPALAAWKCPMILAAIAACGCLATSFVYLYHGSFPHLKGGNASLIYFREIANRTEQTFVTAFKQLTDEEYTNELLGQVWRNSEILTVKFNSLKRSFVWTAIAIIPWGIALALFAMNNTAVGTGLFK